MRVALAGAAYLAGLMAVFAVLTHAIADLRADTEARRDAQSIRIGASRLLKSTLDMETGARAFLITDEERFLEPWYAGRRRLPRELREFERLIRTRAQERTLPASVVVQIGERVKSYVVHSKAVVQHARGSGRNRESDSSLLSEGKRRLDELRVLFARVERAESARAAREDRQAREASSRALVAAGVGLVLLTLFVAVSVSYLARTVTRPISRVARKAQELAAGHFDDPGIGDVPAHTAREVRSLTESFDQMAAAIRDQTGRLQRHNLLLDRRVQERTQELEQARYEALLMLAIAAEFRDDDTHRHTRRVGRNAALVAERLGLGSETVELLRVAAPLHDVGKIGVPDSILLKPGRLTPDEFEAMKHHVVVGAQILGTSREPLFHVAAQIARTHHERWDGSGYPEGLRGAEIPMAGRIVAIVDVFDALSHERPYKTAWTAEEALAEIRRTAGSHFDPAVVAAFESIDPDALVRDDGEPSDGVEPADRS